MRVRMGAVRVCLSPSLGETDCDGFGTRRRGRECAGADACCVAGLARLVQRPGSGVLLPLVWFCSFVFGKGHMQGWGPMMR